MRKFIFLSLLFIIVLGGCQNTEKMPEKTKNIKEVYISEFEGTGLNENFNKKFTKDEEIDAFKILVKNANKQKEEVKQFDYDMKLVLTDGTDRGLRLSKNGKNEIIVKFIGHSDTYVLGAEYSERLIKLIY
ncbi:hypothetical protein [Melghirimyces algeriensis]|uniref:Lipoprotein n=1 Tax=Melghirimyces algeriensis TaxID=910412 RepID=A0A521D3G0_9BACL|nr:hypothetical protein [Melghirimyces algeriensis]SMO66236.1 hypothetical protein SAMN06264849_10591 [Melghirimyces algeriensis]